MNFMKGLNLSHDWIFGGFDGSFSEGYYEICYDCQNQDQRDCWIDALPLCADGSVAT